MTDQLSPLGRWAVEEGLASERVVRLALARGLDLSLAEVEVGSALLAQLRRRGLKVELRPAGPVIGPRAAITDEVLALVRAERDALLAALRAERGERQWLLSSDLAGRPEPGCGSRPPRRRWARTVGMPR